MQKPPLDPKRVNALRLLKSKRVQIKGHLLIWFSGIKNFVLKPNI